MTITQAVCNSFKQELLGAQHNFTTSTGHSFKMALYPSASTLDATNTVYTATGEHASTGTYVAGGKALVIDSGSPGLTSGTGWADFFDLTWASSTITAGGAMIYNTSSSNKACVVLSFGGDKSSSAGDFTVVFPATGATAIIRIA